MKLYLIYFRINEMALRAPLIISCKLMFNLQEILGPKVHILSTHGHIFVTFFVFLLHFC